MASSRRQRRRTTRKRAKGQANNKSGGKRQQRRETLLLAAEGSATTTTAFSEETTLHDVIKNHRRYSLEDIIQFIKTNPKSVRQRDAEGHVALHYACSRGAPLFIVEYLVERYPYGLQVKNIYKALPIHYACDRGASIDVIKFIVKTYPQALDQKAFFGNLPIHLLVAHNNNNNNIGEEENVNLETIKFVIEQYPRGLQITNDDHMMPLQHCWIRQGVEGRFQQYKERLIYMTQQYPQALHHRWICGTSEKHSLLHNELTFRSRNGGSMDGLRFLLNELYYPTSSPTKHVRRIQPEPCRFVIGGSRFHGGRTRQCDLLTLLLEEISFQARKIAEQVEEKRRSKHDSDEPMYLPLTQYALEQRIHDKEIIQNIVKQCPKDLFFRDQLGRNILSLAIWNTSRASGKTKAVRNQQVNIFKYILFNCCSANATLEIDYRHRVALHWTLGWNAPLPVVQDIINHNPKAIFMSDRYGLYPIHFAALRCASIDGIFTLLQADPSQLIRCPFPPEPVNENDDDWYYRVFKKKQPCLRGDYDLTLVHL